MEQSPDRLIRRISLSLRIVIHFAGMGSPQKAESVPSVWKINALESILAEGEHRFSQSEHCFPQIALKLHA